VGSPHACVQLMLRRLVRGDNAVAHPALQLPMNRYHDRLPYVSVGRDREDLGDVY